MSLRKILEELTLNTMGNPPFRIDLAHQQILALLPKEEEMIQIIYNVYRDMRNKDESPIKIFEEKLAQGILAEITHRLEGV